MREKNLYSLIMSNIHPLCHSEEREKIFEAHHFSDLDDKPQWIGGILSHQDIGLTEKLNARNSSGIFQITACVLLQLFHRNVIVIHL